MISQPDLAMMLAGMFSQHYLLKNFWAELNC